MIRIPIIKAKRKKKSPIELVLLEFYHKDSRINFFTADFIIKPLIDSKKLRFYVYQSSGYDWRNAYHYEHSIQVYADQVDVVVEALREEGWGCAKPRPV